MDTKNKVNLYIQDITPHRKRARLLIFVISLLQLSLALAIPIPAFRQHFAALIVVSAVSIIYQAIYWTIIAPRLKSPWAIFIFTSPFSTLLTATAYLSGGILLAGALMLIVTTIVVYKSVQLVLLTLLELLVINTLFAVDLWFYGVSHDRLIGIAILEIATVSVGMMAAVTAFEVQEKEQRMVRLEEIDQIKTTFIAIVSHNLRTPVSVVAGYIELLEKERHRFDQEVTKIIDNLHQSTNSLANLIEDTVRISAYQTGEMQLKYENIPIKTLIESLQKDKFQRQAESKGITLTIQGEKSNNSEYPVDGDSDQLKFMFSEVIDNAIRFTDTGKVVVKLEQQGSDVHITVTDTGKGIPEEFQKLIFSQFSRPGNILQYNERGVGLGLYVTKLIVEAHQGKIEFASKVDVGTTVSIQLPITHKTSLNKEPS